MAQLAKPIPAPSVPLTLQNGIVNPVWYEYLFQNGAGEGLTSVTEANLSLSDVTTGNVSNLRHGFAPKITGSAGYQLTSNGSSALWTAPPSVFSSLYVNIMDHGGNNIGTADNDTAWAACMALRTGRGIAIFFPAGIYRFANQISTEIGAANVRATISVIGAGDILTTLYWPNNGGLRFTTPGAFSQHNIHVKDLSIHAGSAGGGTGLTLENYGDHQQFGFVSTITNVTISGTNPSYNVGSNNYWGIGTDVLSFQYVNFYNVTWLGDWGYPGTQSSHGIGCRLRGSSTSTFCLIYNFQSCQWASLNYGLNYDQYVQGVTLDGCNFNGNSGTAGIYIGPGGDVLQSLLAVSNCQFDWGLYGIWSTSLCYQISVTGSVLTTGVTGGVGINIANNSNLTQISANSFNSNASSTTAVNIGGGNGDVSFIGNTITNYGNGISINARGTVLGNIFRNISGAAYIFGSSSTGCKSSHNSFASVTTVYVDNGTGNVVGGASF